MSDVFLEIGPITIYWYSVLILIAVIIGIFLIVKESPKRKISLAFIMDLIFYLIPVAIIGARLYYVIFNFSLYKNNLLDIFKIWEGGLAIYGAIIASVIFIFFYARKRGQDFISILDVMAPALILGQAIGRWGNFFNREAYGIATTYSHLKELHIPSFIVNNMYINGTYYTPTFLYESLWCLFGFVILMIFRKRHRIKKGMQVANYFIIYGVGRFFIEGLRTDSLYLGNVRVSQLVSLILILIGLGINIYYLVKKTNNKEGVSNVKL